ncbi:MAG: hypothetical protein WBG41_00255 [Acidimicrobiales bacterium]
MTNTQSGCPEGSASIRKRLLAGIARAIEEEVGTEVDDPSSGDRAARSLA